MKREDDNNDKSTNSNNNGDYNDDNNNNNDDDDDVSIVPFKNEEELTEMMHMIASELSEPYSIFTYRYFVSQWPQLTFLARKQKGTGACIGTIVCKADQSRGIFRGYIAMLVVEQQARGSGIGSQLVKSALQALQNQGAAEVFLETEVCNKAAIRLYEKLGFIRDKRLIKYYLNGGDAFRLKLRLFPPVLNDAQEDHEIENSISKG